MSRGRWRIRWGRGAAREVGDATPAGRFVGRLVATVFFLFFFGMGLFFLAMVGREAWRAGETYGWAERRCEIQRSEVVRADGEDPYRPRVAFRTVDAGETVSGSQLQRRAPEYDTWGEAAVRLAPYPVGAFATCWVAPSREAVLERGPVWIGLWALLPLVFVAIGGIGLAATWLPDRKDRLGRPVPESLADKAAGSRRGRGLVVIGVVFVLLGAPLSWFMGVLPLWRVADARGWERQACTVEHSSVQSHASDDGTTYSVDILYRWERGRGVERSSRYSFFGGSSSGYAGKAAIVRAHPKGREVTCWVDPGRANEAVIERGLTLHALVALIPFAFLVGGVALLVSGRRKQRGREMRALRPYAGRAQLPPDDPVFDVLPDFEAGAGPQALETQSSRPGRLLALVCMATFWNGIVSVFAWEAWKSWQRGDPSWGLALFLVPFVLVGIGFVLGIVHALLALANPRPHLVVSARAPLVGEEVELEWRFSGRTRRLERLGISLRGREEARYQVGTDTRTATEPFLERVVTDVPAPISVAGGFARFTIPEDAMHSFESARNKVIWELELVGEIRRWPDVKETYPLVVLPISAAKEER